MSFMSFHGSLFRSPVPLSRARDNPPDDGALSAVRALTTSDDPRHPTEADTTPPIPTPPSGGNPARSPVEDAAADAVPIYLATKHTTYAPSKWRLFYLFMRRHYVEECLTRTPTDLTDAVRHHSTMSRYALFNLLRPRGALTQDEPLEMFNTNDAVEQHDADTDERQRRDADAGAQRWSVATARVRDIDTVLRHCCASALDGIAPGISQPQRATAVRRAISGAMSAAQPIKARQAFAESTIPEHTIPPPPARLGPSDDHANPALASPPAWRAWARHVRDLRPAWAAAQADASTDIRDAPDLRDATADIDTAIIATTRS